MVGVMLESVGILLVMFGTSNVVAKRRTIDRIENRVREEFLGARVWTAFTSGKERGLLEEKSGEKAYSIEECIGGMRQEGIHRIVVQPLYIRNGIEHRKMSCEVEKYKQEFGKIILGEPLLETERDYKAVIRGLEEELPKLKETEAVVFMGHGTKHDVGKRWISINELFYKYGLTNWYMAFLEEKPFITDIVKRLKQHQYRKIYLVPFLMVAGRHARKDMMGEKETSWESILVTNGYDVEIILRGLGEYEFVSELVVRRIHRILRTFI